MASVMSKNTACICSRCPLVRQKQCEGIHHKERRPFAAFTTVQPVKKVAPDAVSWIFKSHVFPGRASQALDGSSLYAQCRDTALTSGWLRARTSILSMFV